MLWQVWMFDEVWNAKSKLNWQMFKERSPIMKYNMHIYAYAYYSSLVNDVWCSGPEIYSSDKMRSLTTNLD